jgi:hypothetical protein
LRRWFHLIAQLFDRQATRHLTGLVPAHPVRHRKQAEVLSDEEVVLIVGPLAANVGQSVGDESHAFDQYHEVLRAAIFG